MKPCPLCSGEVSSFVVADDVAFEMCSNQECIYPFNEEPSDFEQLVADHRPTKNQEPLDGKRKHAVADASTDKKKKKKKSKKSLMEARPSEPSSVVTDILFGSTSASSELKSPSMPVPELTFDMLSHDSTWTTPVTPPDVVPTPNAGAKQFKQQPFVDVSASGIESLLFGDDPLFGTGSFNDATMQLLEHDASFDAILRG